MFNNTTVAYVPVGKLFNILYPSGEVVGPYLKIDINSTNYHVLPVNHNTEYRFPSYAILLPNSRLAGLNPDTTAQIIDGYTEYSIKNTERINYTK